MEDSSLVKENEVNRNTNNLVDISISIVNTSNWKYLEPCIKSIIANIHNIRYEILVVDNVSDDGSPDKIKNAFPEVILSINAQRYGFAKNNNINLRKSSGRYVMLLNDDTLVLPESLDNAIKYLDEHREVGGIGCKMTDPNGKFQYTSARKLPTLFSKLISECALGRIMQRKLMFDGNSAKEIDLPQEAGMILRKEVVDKVGLLDEQFFMYGEGADWCQRIKRAGWKIVYLPSCPIIHFNGVTNRKSSLKMFIQSYKSTYLYFRKGSIITSQLYRILIILIYLIKYFVVTVKSLLNSGQKKQASEILVYYSALINFLVFRLDDPQYPYPIN